ncbi:MAG: sensor histidine kinase, partial [Carbonactinosporaceae bacterium]
MSSDSQQVRSRREELRRSVRFKIVSLVLVPLVSLSALWMFATSITLGDGLNLLHVESVQDHLGYPSGALGSALQKERRLSLVYTGSGGPDERAAMESQRIRTDQQASLFRRLASDEDARSDASELAQRRADEVLTHLRRLDDFRDQVDRGSVDRAQVFVTYSEVVGSVTSLQSSLSTLSDPGVAKDYQTLLALARARELLSQEDGLLSGALAAGHLTSAEHATFVKIVGAQRTMYAQTAADLPAADHAYYREIVATSQYERLRSLENQVIYDTRPGKPAPVTDTQWKTTADSMLTRLRGVELAANQGVEERSKPIATDVIRRVTLAGVVGLAAVVISIIISVQVARSVIRDLTGLKNAALELANEQLPGVVSRLRRGLHVDTAEAPPLSFRTTEIDQVGQAFNAARTTAVQGAVEEATLRRSVSEIFINLARRSQALLHRQLSLLDTLERRETEPDALEDLFRLDHFATRMRRHAESLIILSGSTPGRRWRNPVPVIDVVRAAAAEVEDYARVTVLPMSRVSFIGQAVTDLIHLFAELIENATQFSPPNTPVQVTGQVVASGFVVEVEDRGLSMSTEELAAANERLADPPEFDLFDTAQLGLFVVGRLATRHDIKVTLRHSPYGGTTAIVLIPQGIIVRDDEAEPYARPGGVGVGVSGRGHDGFERIPARVGGDAPAEWPARVGEGPSAEGRVRRLRLHQGGELDEPYQGRQTVPTQPPTLQPTPLYRGRAGLLAGVRPGR